MELIQSVAAKMVEEPFKLLIVDSIMANFRVDFSGRGELADRQQKLGQMMSQLKKVGLVLMGGIRLFTPLCNIRQTGSRCMQTV